MRPPPGRRTPRGRRRRQPDGHARVADGRLQPQAGGSEAVLGRAGGPLAGRVERRPVQVDDRGARFLERGPERRRQDDEAAGYREARSHHLAEVRALPAGPVDVGRAQPRRAVRRDPAPPASRHPGRRRGPGLGVCRVVVSVIVAPPSGVRPTQRPDGVDGPGHRSREARTNGPPEQANRSVAAAPEGNLQGAARVEAELLVADAEREHGGAGRRAADGERSRGR